MPELTPAMISLTQQECYVRIRDDGDLELRFRDTHCLALGYEWVMKELCRIALKAAHDD